ncbi:MAG: hypothetical protein ACK5N0_13950 [Synechococcaceae cyanobacterium]
MPFAVGKLGFLALAEIESAQISREVAALVLPRFPDPNDGVISLMAPIPASPIQAGKAAAEVKLDCGAKHHRSSCLATNNSTNRSLNPIENAVGDAVRGAACFAVQLHALVAIELADHESLPPP